MYYNLKPTPLCAEGKGESEPGEGEGVAADDSDAGEGWHARPRGPNETMIQSGVIRVNCIDCLDRTNLAQRTAGHFVLAMQLTAMGLQISEEDLNLQTLRAHHLDLAAVVSRPPEAKPVGRVLESLYEDLGDHISLQYAGSTAHRKVGAATEVRWHPDCYRYFCANPSHNLIHSPYHLWSSHFYVPLHFVRIRLII